MEQQTVEMIAQLVLQTINQMGKESGGYQVPVGVSARHIHLTQEHVEVLFGEGYKLTKKKELMGGQYACNETVTVVGLKLRAIENVRVLGPVRKASQLEISATDAMEWRRLSGNPAMWREALRWLWWAPRASYICRRAVSSLCVIFICRRRMLRQQESGTEISFPSRRTMRGARYSIR